MSDTSELFEKLRALNARVNEADDDDDLEDDVEGDIEDSDIPDEDSEEDVSVEDPAEDSPEGDEFVEDSETDPNPPDADNPSPAVSAGEGDKVEVKTTVDVKKDEDDEASDKDENQLLGSKAGEFFYIEKEEGKVTIKNAEKHEVYSEPTPTDDAGFIAFLNNAISKLDIDMVSYDIVNDYILPYAEEEDEATKTMPDGEPTDEPQDETPAEDADELPPQEGDSPNSDQLESIKAVAEKIWKDKYLPIKEADGSWEKEKSNLYQHALTELKLAGLLDKDSDYNGMLGEAVLDIVEIFAKQGHSGFSAAMTVQLLEKLLRYEALTEITNNPEEWFNCVEKYGKDVVGADISLFQCKRNPALFSTDGGKTYYNVDRRDEVITAKQYEGMKSKQLESTKQEDDIFKYTPQCDKCGKGDEMTAHLKDTDEYVCKACYSKVKESVNESYDPQLSSPEAKAVYDKIADYMMTASDPQYNRIVRFRLSIARLPEGKDKDELKKYFEAEFMDSSFIKGKTAWEYFDKLDEAKKDNKIRLIKVEKLVPGDVVVYMDDEAEVADIDDEDEIIHVWFEDGQDVEFDRGDKVEILPRKNESINEDHFEVGDKVCKNGSDECFTVVAVHGNPKGDHSYELSDKSEASFDELVAVESKHVAKLNKQFQLKEGVSYRSLDIDTFAKILKTGRYEIASASEHNWLDGRFDLREFQNFWIDENDDTMVAFAGEGNNGRHIEFGLRECKLDEDVTRMLGMMLND